MNPSYHLGMGPSFIVIGAVKAATTWIQKQLQAHPAVFMPDVEPHYFSSEFHRGPGYYEGLFSAAPARAVLGEKSADYFAHPLAAERIAQTFPDAKLIVQFRNPTDRAYSDYKMLFRRGTVQGPPEDYLRTPNCAQSRFLRDGLYARHLARWLEHFPVENILPILFEDVRERPQDTLDKVCRHIGIRPQYVVARTRRENDSTEKFLPLPMRKALSPIREIVAPLRGSRWFEATRGIMARPIKYPSLPPALRLEIDSYYADDIAALEKMIGRDLGRWRSRQASDVAA